MKLDKVLCGVYHALDIALQKLVIFEGIFKAGPEKKAPGHPPRSQRLLNGT